MGSDAKAGYGAEARGELLLFDPDKVRTANEPGHPRYDKFRNYEISETFVQDIAENGVLEPIIVNRRGYVNGVPQVDTVVGTRRILHARVVKQRQLAAGVAEADTIRVPGVPRRGSDGQLYAVMISENEHRLNDTAYARAMKCMHYVETMGHTKEEAAVRFGKSVTAIEQWLTFAECSETIQEAVRQKQITIKVALTLAKLPREKQSEELAKLAAESDGKIHGQAETKRVEREVEKRTGKSRRPRMRGRKTIERMRDVIVEAEQRLSPTGLLRPPPIGSELPTAGQILSYLLGDEEALPQKWKDLLKEPAKKVKGKKAAA
jgi:ParB-like chromosome segregation protein Spo0J